MSTSRNGTRRTKSSIQMTTAELEAAAAIFDQEFVADLARQPNPLERKQWQKAKRKMGRPKIGQGAQVISVSVEKGLLKQADQLAKRLRISRASLISHGLAKLLKPELP